MLLLLIFWQLLLVTDVCDAIDRNGDDRSVITLLCVFVCCYPATR